MDSLNRVSDEDFSEIYSTGFDNGSEHATKLDVQGVARIAFYAGYCRGKPADVETSLDDVLAMCEESFKVWAKSLTADNMPSGWDKIVNAINDIK